jgi:hypothetical protein
VIDHPDRPALSEEDLAIATLLGRYIERRDRGLTPAVHDLTAAAAEFGDHAATTLRTVIAFYEAIRGDEAR